MKQVKLFLVDNFIKTEESINKFLIKEKADLIDIKIEHYNRKNKFIDDGIIIIITYIA